MAKTKNNTEILLRTENQQEAVEVMKFLGELAQEEKKDFLIFIQGIRFAKRMVERTLT